MTVKNIVDLMTQLMAEWATPKIPLHLQGVQTGVAMPLRCSASEATKTMIAEHLPESLANFWSKFLRATLFEDVNYGQWGLSILDYELSNQRTRHFNRERPGDAKRGDRIIGEFIGDLEQLLIRCDNANGDFGHLLVVLPASPRVEWYWVADSLSSFLDKYSSHEGQKYWEPQFSNRNKNLNAAGSQ